MRAGRCAPRPPTRWGGSAPSPPSRRWARRFHTRSATCAKRRRPRSARSRARRLSELGLDYEKQRASFENYEVKGEDAFCKKPISEPRKAGELWVDGEGIASFSSPACTLGAYVDLKAKGKKITVAYVFDTERGIKLFADQAFFAVGGSEIAPFLLKKDAEAHAAKIGGKVVNFNDALKSAMSGG
jgi:NitT/TauT family transport system substrate-binding protein